MILEKHSAQCLAHCEDTTCVNYCRQLPRPLEVPKSALNHGVGVGSIGDVSPLTALLTAFCPPPTPFGDSTAC